MSYTNDQDFNSPYAFVGQDDPYAVSNDYDSLFGLGRNRQLKKAEKKVQKAAVKLEHGDTRAAARKLAKGNAILAKVDQGQQATLSSMTQLQNIYDTQGQLSLSTQPMSSTGSSMGPISSGQGEVSSNTGIESEAQRTTWEEANNPSSDEPTGWLADPKTLGNVVVKAKKPSGLIIFGILILIVAIVYFAPKLLKRK